MAMCRRPPAEGWWSERVVWGALAVSSLVLIGCRTDLLLALAAGFATRWGRDRQRADAVVAALLAATAATATLLLVHHYAHATYRDDLSVVQLPHNFRGALPAVVATLFLVAPVGPLLMLWRHPTGLATVREVAIRDLPVLMLVAVEVGASLVVVQVDDVRLFFPIGFALAWVGVDLWATVISAIEPEIV
jgi:hypothetical protein